MTFEKMFSTLDILESQKEMNRYFNQPEIIGIDRFCEKSGWVMLTTKEKLRKNVFYRVRPPETFAHLLKDGVTRVVIPRPMSELDIKTKITVYQRLFLVDGSEVTQTNLANLQLYRSTEGLIAFSSERDAYDYMYWISK